MNAKELIKLLMVEQNVTDADLARRLDISQAALWERISPKKSNNMSVHCVVEMLDALDYELCAVPRGARTPAGTLKLD